MSTPAVDSSSSLNSSSVSFLNDTMSVQAKQKEGATTAAGLVLSGSLMVEQEGTSCIVGSGSVGNTYNAANILPPAAPIEDPESYTASMQQLIASVPKAIASLQAATQFGEACLKSFMQGAPSVLDKATLTTATSLFNQFGGKSLASSLQSEASTERASTPERATLSNNTTPAETTTTSVGGTTSDNVTLSESTTTPHNTTPAESTTTSNSTTSAETTSEAEPASSSYLEPGDEDSGEINMQAILNDLATLMENISNCTEGEEQAAINQTQDQVAEMDISANQLQSSAQGPLNAAKLSLFMSVGAAALTMGGMGYASDQAETQEEELSAASTEGVSNSTEALSNSAEHIEEQAMSGATIGGEHNDPIGALEKEAAQLKSMANTHSVAVNVSESGKAASVEAETTTNIAKLHNTQKELKDALTDLQKTMKEEKTPSQAQLDKLETSVAKMRKFSNDLKVSPNMSDEEKEQVMTLKSKATQTATQGEKILSQGRDRNALEAAKKAQASTKEAVENPEDEAKQKRAEDDIATAQAAGKKKGVSPEVQKQVETIIARSKGKLPALYPKASPEEGERDSFSSTMGNLGERPSEIERDSLSSLNSEIGRGPLLGHPVDADDLEERESVDVPRASTTTRSSVTISEEEVHPMEEEGEEEPTTPLSQAALKEKDPQFSMTKESDQMEQIPGDLEETELTKEEIDTKINTSKMEMGKATEEALREDAPLTSMKEPTQKALHSSVVRLKRISSKANEDAHFFSSKEGGEGRIFKDRNQGISATRKVNAELQKLSSAAKRFKENPTKENKTGFESQIKATKESIDKNPEAYSTVQANARAAAKKAENMDPASLDVEGIEGHAASSNGALKRVTNRKTTRTSDAYNNTFFNTFGLFSIINALNNSGTQLVQAYGQKQQLEEQAASKRSDADATAYGQGLTLSNQNLSLLTSLLQSLQSSYNQVSQSLVSDVQFVHGAM